ncbi:MAG: hypothetical protein GY792_05630, partial [Gammaproteobacteria bacterium]|nr:hypothetical protein [Gammaproteobacteria bacterium]
MRLLLTGKTRSGKSTTLHRFLSHALRQRWLDVLLLDGKGTKLSLYGDLPSVDYFGPDEIEAWLERLEDAAANLTTRFADLVNRDLEVAPDDELRQLIVVDEVQRGTRAKNGIGPKIKEALALIAEQSGALNDVLVVASQRGPGAIPPGVRHNCNANIQMLGKGYFFYRADGQPTRSGRAAHIEAEAAASMAAEAEPDGLRVDPANLPAILGTIEVEPTRAPAKLYLGKPGSGKTWALKELHVERVNGYERFLYVDLAQPHRSVLSELIESAGATVPARVPIPDLAEIAALSIQAEPTLLLLDNLHAAAPKVRPSIERLMIGAASVGLSANEPRTPTDTRRLKPFVARCSVEELKPLR